MTVGVGVPVALMRGDACDSVMARA